MSITQTHSKGKNKMSDGSRTVYLVVSEQYYGGEETRAFDNEKDAEVYMMQWIDKTRGKLDVIVKKIDLVQM